MKYLINLYSQFVGWRFAKSYASNPTSQGTQNLLERYIELRQMLPVVTHTDFRGEVRSAHFGNHYGSLYKPWKATQGIN